MELVYSELRALAQSHLATSGPDQTLQATAIVHEAYLRLVDQSRAQYRDRNHFFAVAATVIRRVLVDAARARAASKRGGDWSRLTIDSALGWTGPHDLDLVALDDALRRLAQLSERQARVVELRFFAGLTIDQASQALGVSTTTVENEWAIARAWLRRELSGEGGA
jgi:RNA polymerase sigma factor (TIGR02999 family)